MKSNMVLSNKMLMLLTFTVQICTKFDCSSTRFYIFFWRNLCSFHEGTVVNTWCPHQDNENAFYFWYADSHKNIFIRWMDVESAFFDHFGFHQELENSANQYSIFSCVFLCKVFGLFLILHNRKRLSRTNQSSSTVLRWGIRIALSIQLEKVLLCIYGEKNRKITQKSSPRPHIVCIRVYMRGNAAWWWWYPPTQKYLFMGYHK